MYFMRGEKHQLPTKAADKLNALIVRWLREQRLLWADDYGGRADGQGGRLAAEPAPEQAGELPWINLDQEEHVHSGRDL